MKLFSSKIYVPLIILCFLIISALIVPGIILRNDRIAAFVKWKVEEGVAKIFGRQVKIERVGFHGLFPELFGVKIDEPDGRPVLEAERIRVGFDLFALAFSGGSISSALKRMDLYAPTLWMTIGENGKLAFPKLFGQKSRTSTKQTKLGMVLGIHNGNFLISAPEERWPWGDFSAIEGEVDFRAYPGISGSLKFKSSLDNEVEGRIVINFVNGGERTLEVEAEHGEARLWGERVFGYFDLTDQYQFTAGKADAVLHFSWGERFRFDSARVRLDNTDFKWHKLSAPLKAVNAEFDFDASGLDFQRFKGYYNKSQFDIRGEIRNGSATEPAGMNLKVYAKELEAAEWRGLIPALQKANASGLVDLNLQLQGAISKPQVRGEVLIKDGNLTSYGGDFNLERLRLLAKLDGEEISLDYAEGYVNKALFFMQGTLNGWDDPDLDLNFRAKNFKIEKLLSVLSQDQRMQASLGAGPVDVDVKISRRLSAPSIKGEIQTPFLSWRGFSGEDLHFIGEYDWERDLLEVDSLTLRAFAGEGRIRGTVGSLRKQMVFGLKSDWKQVDLAGIPWQEISDKRIPALAGRADFRFALDGSFPSLQAVCDLSVVEASIDQFKFDALDTKITWDEEQLTARLAMKRADGTVIGDLAWEPSTSDYSGDFLLRNLELNSQLLPGEISPMQGSIQGKISGAVNVRNEHKGPVGKGWLEVHDLAYKEKRLGDLKLRGVLNEQGIKLQNSSLQMEGNQLGITGEVCWQKEPYYDLRLNGTDITADRILSLLCPTDLPVKVEGLAALEVSVQGWKNPEVSGELSLDQLSLYDIGVERVEAGFTWNNHVLNLEDLHLYQGGGEMSVAGKITGENLDLNVSTNGLPLTSLKRNGRNFLILAGKEVAGQLKLEGKIQGKVKAPVFKGEVMVDDLSLAGLGLDRITGQLNWNDNILSMDEMRIDRADQQLKAYGQVDFSRTIDRKNGEEPSLDLGIKMEETRISDLLLVLGVSSKATVDGRVNGYLRVLGPLNQPLVRIISQFNEGRVNGYSNISGELDLQMEGETVIINRLLLDDREGEFFASGTYTPGKYLQTSVRMNNFPLETIVALTDYDKSLTGRIDLQADLDTESQGMTGVFSGGIANASFGKTRIPAFNLTGTLDDDLLSINYEGIEDKLKIWGNIPLSPQWFGSLELPSRWPHQNQEWNVRLVAADLDAVLLNPFFGASPENRSPLGGSYIRSGTINGDLSLKGMWNHLYLQGMLEVSDLDTAFPGLPEEFRNVQGKLDFSKDSLRVTALKGRYGEGHFQTAGGIALNGLRPVEFDLKLSGDKLYYTNPLFSGLINARLQLSGPFTGPLLSGDVTVEKTRISVGSLKSSSSARNLDLGFDLDIKAGHEVYFRQYGLANIPLSGGIHVGGTLKQLVLAGEFTADRGSVTVYGDTFRINTARAEFKPEYLTLPYLELEADLYLSGTEITLSTQGWVGDDLALNLTSNPAMSREEIFALLNWAEGFEESSDQLFVANLVQGNINTVTDTLFGPFIDEFRDLMNIDYFSLEQDRDLGSFRMNLGKSLDDDVYLSYSRSLTDITEEVWTLEWQISPAFSLIGDFSNDFGYEWQLLYRLMF